TGAYLTDLIGHRDRGELRVEALCIGVLHEHGDVRAGIGGGVRLEAARAQVGDGVEDLHRSRQQIADRRLGGGDHAVHPQGVGLGELADLGEVVGGAGGEHLGEVVFGGGDPRVDEV